MILQEYFNLVDKSSWPRGQWDEEPDRVNLLINGFYCQIERHRMHGSLNGYVGVPPGHPVYGIRFEDLYKEYPTIDVHGGLTFSQHAREESLLGYLPNVPYETGPGLTWWIGFDCAHYMDFAPGMGYILTAITGSAGIYKNIEFVTNELTSLTKDLVGCSIISSP